MRRILKSALLTTAMVMTAGTALAATTSQVAGHASAMPSGVYQPELLSSPPALTPAQAAAREAWAARERGHGTIDVSRKAVAGPVAGTEAQITEAQELNIDGDAPSSVEPAAPNTFTIYTNKFVKPYLAVPPLSSSSVSEPAHANAGKYVFYTGNWYAALSKNKGGTWTYINPYADFADFCCDQDVIYDAGRDMLIWYRQGVQLGGGNNNFKLGVSLDGGLTWTQYTLTYTNYGGLPLGWFDYPHLAVTRNYLYWTTNYFNTNGTFQRMIVNRLSLDQLQARGGLSWSWWNRTTGWTWTPAQGATDVFYLGDHTNTSTFNICDIPESTGLMSCRDVAIAAWTFTNRGDAVCTVPNGFNPCARLDQRVTDGWVRGNEVGFFWTVQEGGGFAYPYVESATFNRTTFAYTGRPYIWSGGAAWIYGGSAPNARGDLGIAAYYVGGGLYPRLYVGIDDDYNAAPPGWEIALVRSSVTSTSHNWGDYLRVRQHGPDGNTWSVSGHTTQTVTTYGNVQEGSFATFGRGRDKDGYDRFRTK